MSKSPYALAGAGATQPPKIPQRQAPRMLGRPGDEEEAAAALIALGSDSPCDVETAFYERPTRCSSETHPASSASTERATSTRKGQADTSVDINVLGSTPESRQHTDRSTPRRGCRDTGNRSRLRFESGPGVSRSRTAGKQPRTNIPGRQPPRERLPVIRLRVSTGVNVSQDHNIIALGNTQAELANSITSAVVAALKSTSVAHSGSPILDHDIYVEVDAGITVEGAHNIVGTEEFVKEVMKTRHTFLREQPESSAPFTLDEQQG